jgi:NADPH-dependent 2,4-dienoyl-CoA reductase/sulfur reductase-like enzyme
VRRLHPSRREFATGVGAGIASAMLPRPMLAQGAAPKIVVIGGGFAGLTAARMAKRYDKGLDVTVVEANPTYTACPFSNDVIAGLRDIKEQQFGYGKVAGDGIKLAQTNATGIDATGRTVALANGSTLNYDRLILAPGIDLRFDALPGYDEAAAQRMPHAWKAGEQTMLLRRQIEAMEDGGVVVIVSPQNPYRCPPGPYERASLIAWYLKAKKPRSKVMILDAKDAFSKQRLFQNAWKQMYPNLEWVSLSMGGKVSSVDPATNTVATDFDKVKAAVANVIPPQKAGRIAQIAGATDRSGWCPIDAVSFESKQVPNIHVIGDAAIAGAMPKSAFAANSQAKVCAVAVAKLARGEKPETPKLINTCYSLVAPDYGVSVAAIYHPVNGALAEVAGSGGVSPVDAPLAERKEEAELADGWFHTITSEVFG